LSSSHLANHASSGLTAQYGTSAITGLPSIAYSVDGEGRTYSATASAGQNPLTSTLYNTGSLPTNVTFGSTDQDAFTYDPNTNRMTEYEFNINGQAVSGVLTWNAIGTLESLVITDPFSSSGNQSCSYTHDDLKRIASASCGSSWSQTFSYDAFGNLSKNGSQSFQPTYSNLTNHMTLIGGSTPSYDANGNVTNDFLNSYSWDGNGRPVSVDGVGVTYDALGRMAEQNKSGTYLDFLYTPGGNKLAIMIWPALQKAFVPLAAGAVAVYNSSGIAYYRHPDWVGSSRFASTPTRGLYYDGAYAPFGEPYAQTGTTDVAFTGMNQDTSANVYDFPAREYGIQGRWPSPDPSGMASVRPSNPQSWNRYAYVLNNPLANIDPSGLDCLVADGSPEDITDDVTVDRDTCGDDGGIYVDGSVDTSSLVCDGSGLLSFNFTDSNGNLGI
jgi:RHS repeat-associated protein